ncbi:tyrosine-type recombinase/integrase, partial [Paractinoplanes ferrugineus]
MATLERRGESLRVSWRLGGSRDGARQSCSFSGPPAERERLAQAAQALVEARRHNITRAECYDAVLNRPAADVQVMPTFRAWVQMWLREREQARDIEATTIKNYRWVLTARAIPRLGHLRLDDITEETIREWVAWMATRRSTRGNRNRNVAANQLLSAETIGKAYRVLHGCLGAAVPRWLQSNPASRRAGSRRGVPGLPKGDKFEGMFLDPGEVALIRSHCDRRILAMVDTALATGLRLGELVALQAQHITSNGRQTVVQVRQTLKDDGTIGPPKSKAGTRGVPVDEETGRLLLDRIAGKPPRAWV